MSKKLPPRLDLTAMRFPGDQVTMAQIRAEDPEFYTTEGFMDGRVNELSVFAMSKTEVEFAETAFAKALGLPEPHPEESQAVRISWLNLDYKRYGISTGIHTTKQLLREVEKTAVDQAKQFRAR
jgi:hypothetical protein